MPTVFSKNSSGRENTENNALIIENDLSIARALEWLLNGMNIRSTLVASGADAIVNLKSTTYEIILLDLSLDDMDGLDILKAIPAGIDARILVLSADDNPRRKVAALTSGARDYVVKPFDHAELCARIKLVMRKYAVGNSVQMTGPIQIDRVNHTVKVNGEPMQLTRTEQDILEILSENKGKIIPKNELMLRIYNNEWQSMNDSVIGVYIFKIRQKIALLGGPKDGCIQSVKGRGYIFNDPTRAAFNENYAVWDQ